jgi:hypothetical protein
MNYDGHEALRRDMAGLANNLCDLKTTLKVLEGRHVPLPVRRTGGTACRYQSATSQRPDG